MNKPLTAITILAGTVFLGSGGWLLYGHFSAKDAALIEIVQDGEVLYTLDLHKEQDHSMRIEHDGSYNLITIRNGEIFMEDAGCPDHTCMKMGVLREANLPIVCLPNKLVIRFAEEADHAN